MPRTGALLAAVVVCLALLAGTAAAEDPNDMELTFSVTDEATIEQVDFEFFLEQSEYDDRVDDLEDGDVATAFAEDLVEANPEYGDYAGTDETETDDGVVLSVELVAVDADLTAGTTVSEGDGTVSLEMTSLVDPGDDPSIDTVVFAVDMPGEITESNADEEDGSLATWHLHEEVPESLSVEAEADEEDGLTGFGSGVALLVLGVGLVFLARRTQNAYSG